VLLFAVMIIVLTGAQLISTSFKETKYQQNFVAEAENVARAGIVDTISWFRRQSTVVKSGPSPTPPHWIDEPFNPKYDADPTKSYTIDENIGLVKEYQLSENGVKWARYEIKRQTNPAVAPYDSNAVHDITGSRIPSKQDGDGLAWSIVSTGYVYRKVGTGPFTSPPDILISRAKVSTEIRRIDITRPENSAVIVGNANNVVINKNGRIRGGISNAGIARKSGSPTIDTRGEVTGNPPVAPANGTYDLSVIGIFGISDLELRSLADRCEVVFSTPIPDMSLIYINGNATFTESKPLRSSGILIINGDLTIEEHSNSLYSGLIYITGNAVINTPCLISGCLIVNGSLTLSSSSATDVAEIDYDESWINTVIQQVCQYRENKSLTHTFKLIQGM